jgi:hypothetical protein
VRVVLIVGDKNATPYTEKVGNIWLKKWEGCYPSLEGGNDGKFLHICRYMYMYINIYKNDGSYLFTCSLKICCNFDFLQAIQGIYGKSIRVFNIFFSADRALARS